MTKKLEGNGLWESSRMMLPQHKEQSLRTPSGKPASPSEPPTTKEMELMRDYILLPVALRIVEKKRTEIEMSSETLKGLYSAAAHVLAKHIREDMRKSKKVLLESNIRVFEDSKGDTELHYRYTCRSHADELVMTKDFMRTEISARIGRYVRSLVLTLQDAAKVK
jgi:hypothetical protein